MSDGPAAGGPSASVPAGATVPAGGTVRPRRLYSQPSFLVTVLAGGAVGTLLRYLLEEAVPIAPGRWPWTTFWINVVGSFILGTLLTALARGGPDEGWRRRARLGLGTGFCGGFTTYSTFVIEVDSLVRGGWVGTGVAYALVSVVVGVVAALAGVLLARSWPRSRGAAA